VPERTQATEGERIAVMRVSIDEALAALPRGAMHNGPLVIALQWLALNRARLPELLTKSKA
jgi:ADP-ribose pyrophosphatase